MLKNNPLKISGIAAKVAGRLVLFAALIALVPFFSGDMDNQLKNVYITTSNKWLLAAPIILIVGFITLLVICTIKKYREMDLNWLLVLNSVILLTYGVSVFIRIQHFVK